MRCCENTRILVNDGNKGIAEKVSSPTGMGDMCVSGRAVFIAVSASENKSQPEGIPLLSINQL